MPQSKALYGKAMIDSEYKVKRYITEFSEKTEELLAEYDLNSFELSEFQKEFNETNDKNPMFECYPIKPENVGFLKKYISDSPEWDFSSKSYFVESHGI